MLKVGNTVVDSLKVKKYWKECCNLIPKEQRQKKILNEVFIYAKSKIIETVILEQLIDKQEIEIYFDEIQKEYKKIITEKKIENLSKEKKYSLQAQIEKDLKIRNLLNKWQKNILEPTDEQCLNYYEKNKNQFKENEKFIFKALIVNKKIKNSKKKIENILAFFNKRGDFDDFKKYQNENIEYKNRLAIERNVLPQEIESSLLTMNQGDISSIIESGDSYSLFQYIDYIPQSFQSYLAVKDRVKEILLIQKKEQKKNEKIDQYKKQISIEDNLKVEEFID